MKKQITYIFFVLLVAVVIQPGFPQAASANLSVNGKANSISIENSTSSGSSKAVISKNYFHIDNSRKSLWNGKHWKSTDFPLKVYVARTNSKLFKPLFNKFIDYAFKVWQKADARISFEYVSAKENADITILFEDNLSDKYNDNYLGLTDYELTKTNEILNSAIQISFLKVNGTRLNDGELKATIIHELGHAIGLGHSGNNADIMYPFIDSNFNPDMNYNDLTTGDASSVKSLLDIGFKNQYTKL